ncbi:hypothetical protein I302_106241 [Kwoniella bestiolae CBS 10118]|uniref:Ricin B lectin domain-containing protein n=1 Tax=Kwoniella bestiolae CBS 10118 TaxID=1296100 RepID=A0A1B9G3D9_9TREE|nr:hypothetical protein I302_05365 [Kwoniella bestiolae CBS 10118]OCF25545.1 hypothetical protein I302_05365 [Kwoniella bestiolae CBS 10118]
MYKAVIAMLSIVGAVAAIETISPRSSGDLCLTVAADKPIAGAKVQLVECVEPSSTKAASQKWEDVTRDVGGLQAIGLAGAENLCLDRGANESSGVTVQKCLDPTPEQLWSYRSEGTLYAYFGDERRCLEASGEEVELVACEDNNDQQVWDFRADVPWAVVNAFALTSKN